MKTNFLKKLKVFGKRLKTIKKCGFNNLSIWLTPASKSIVWGVNYQNWQYI